MSVTDNQSKKCKLLYVEDNVDNQLLLSFYVRKEAFDLETAIDARTALEKIEATDYDIFLVDLNLPGEFSGLELVQKIKSDPANSEKPVLILSALTDSKTVTTATELGVANVLSKPIKKADFLAVLKDICGK